VKGGKAMIIFATHELQARLEKIRPFFAKNKGFPILNCVRVTPKLLSYASLGGFVFVPMQGGGLGDFMISFPALYEFVRNSNADEIRVSERKGNITVSDGRGEIVQDEFFSPEDFPKPPVNDFNLAGSATIEQIHHAFSCYYAAHDTDIRFSLHGVCIDAPTNRVVATDGHRLSFRTMDFSLAIKNQIVIPKAVVRGILHITKGTSGVVQFAPSESNPEWVALELWDISIYARVRNQYPDYKSVIPQHGSLKLMITNPKTVIKQLQDIKKRTPKTKTLALKGDTDGTVRVANGSYKGALDGCNAVKECFFLVNIEYLIECLRQYEKNPAPVNVWNKNDKTNAWFFCAEGSLDLDLIMPLRGNDEELWFAADETPQVVDAPATETPQTVDTPANETPQETDKLPSAPPQRVAPSANKPTKKVATPKPKIEQPARTEKVAGLEWGKKLARALRKRGIRSVAPWGDRLLKVSDRKRETFYLAAAYYLVKSR
jgi:DNA polymerase III sliding clamp (beta) subunit (PCNA family)